MDTYENNIPREEENQTPQVEAENQEFQPETPQEDLDEAVEVTQEEETQEEETQEEVFCEETPCVEDQPVGESKKQKKKWDLWKPLLAIFLAACLVVGTCYITANVLNGSWEREIKEMTKQYDAQLADLEKKVAAAGEVILIPGKTQESGQYFTPAEIYAANVKSVVMIYNKVTSTQGGISTSSGSGFIISEDGFVVTNQHVIDGNGSITVITTDGTEYPAVLVGADDANDVALLKVEAEGLRAVTLGKSSEMIVGDQVAAIGNPLGELTSTLTVGYISAKERDVTTDGFAINMLQTDAAINSGNSGGPLFNMRGEVIGITTAKYSGTSSSGASIEGIGFAIPIDDVAGILDDLAAYGHVTGGYLGVMVSDMDAEAANYYGFPVGAYVQEVTPGYAAQKAGLRAKDIIVSLGGYEVRNVNSLTRALRHFKAGDEVTIVVYRSGREVTFTAVLDEKPAE